MSLIFSRLNILFVLFSFISLSVSAQFREKYKSVDKYNDINGMSFLTPSTGFVAFSKNIGFTQDSGHSFVFRTVTYSNTNFNGYFGVNLTFGFHSGGVVAFSKDSLFIYGDYGFEPSILFSSNQGLNWKLVYHKPLSNLSNTITDMQFPANGNIGFAVQNEEIIQTTNRGQSWTSNLLTPAQIKLSFPTAQTGYSVGYNKIFKTINGGVTWSAIQSPVAGSTTSNLNNASFLTNQFGYVSDEQEGNIFQTSDGGAHWRQMNDPTIMPISGKDMHFINDSVGLITAGLYYVYKTTDSGKTWEPCKKLPDYSNSGYRMLSLFFYNNQIGWAGGMGEYLSITTNAGGIPSPRGAFRIDTLGLSNDNIVDLNNYSKKGYQYKWYRNDTLISTNYNTSYVHTLYQSRDTIKLIVSNISGSDTIIYYQSFKIPQAPLLPEIQYFTPTYGMTGTKITIIGKNFMNVQSVSFGGIGASSFTVNSTISIDAYIGAGKSGDVTVKTIDGIASKSGFVFLPAPIIFSFAPTSAITGTVVTIKGQHFTNATKVTFGGMEAYFNVVSDSVFSATIGFEAASGDVSVTTYYGTGSLGGFIFNHAPAITAITPSYGGNGTVVKIIGKYFTGTSTVRFGGVPAASFTVLSDDTISAKLGTGAAGNVAVKNTYGTAVTGIFSYRYPPKITSFTPSIGGEGSVIDITGSGFEYSGTSVSIGGVPAVSFTVNSSVSITAIVGKGASGSISVGTAYGTAGATTFTWLPKPSITSFFPLSCKAGDSVTIKGQNFSNVIEVTFGGSSATAFRVISSTEISAVVGSGSSGNVTVVTPGGEASLSGFSLLTSLPPVITSFSPMQGNIGTKVTITGKNFSPMASDNIVYVGGVKTVPSSATSTSLMVIVPQGASYKPITVTTHNLTAYSQNSFIVTFNSSFTFNTNSFNAKNDTVAINYRHISINDINADGKMDLLITTDNSGFSIFKNTSVNQNISFLPEERFLKDNWFSTNTVGDLDGDGKPDLIFGEHFTNGNIIIVRNLSTTSDFLFGNRISYPTEDYANGVDIGDLNLDGKPDLVFANENHSISVLINSTEGGIISFAKQIKYPIIYNPHSVAIGDLNGDGKPEIVVAHTNLSIFTNNTIGTTIDFSIKTDFQDNKVYTGVKLADLDKDGKLDVILSSYNGISIYRNISIGNVVYLAPRIDLKIKGDLTWNVAISDLDGDGKVDIAANEYWFIDSFVVFKNLSFPGTISFGEKFEYPTAKFPMGLAIGDLNGDGKPDMVSGCQLLDSAHNILTFFTNLSSGILPYNPIRLTGSLENDHSFIQWDLVDNQNISSFIVEHSIDGVLFVPIGNVKYNSNSYSFIHSNPNKGFNYYRLKIINTDGSFNYSNIAVLNFKKGNITILVKPNPAHDYVIVEHPTTLSAEIKLIDMMGRVVKTSSVQRNTVQTKINLNDISRGIYKVIWSNGNDIGSSTLIIE